MNTVFFFLGKYRSEKILKNTFNKFSDFFEVFFSIKKNSFWPQSAVK